MKANTLRFEQESEFSMATCRTFQEARTYADSLGCVIPKITSCTIEWLEKVVKNEEL